MTKKGSTLIQRPQCAGRAGEQQHARWNGLAERKEGRRNDFYGGNSVVSKGKLGAEIPQMFRSREATALGEGLLKKKSLSSSNVPGLDTVT